MPVLPGADSRPPNARLWFHLTRHAIAKPNLSWWRALRCKDVALQIVYNPRKAELLGNSMRPKAAVPHRLVPAVIFGPGSSVLFCGIATAMELVWMKTFVSQMKAVFRYREHSKAAFMLES